MDKTALIESCSRYSRRIGMCMGLYRVEFVVGAEEGEDLGP